LTRSGERVAIVGWLDQAIPPATGAWNQVVVHPGDMKELLLQTLARLNPQQIAINYSLYNPKADGLSYGNYLRLQDMFKDTPFLARLVSADALVTRLRGRKSPSEVTLLREAIRHTDEIFATVKGYLRPGLTGREIYGFIQSEIERRNLQPAWSRDHCPIVTVGPLLPIGHTPPNDIVLQCGWTLQIDMGVKANGYCSDFQRMWYVLEEGETTPPPEVQRLFTAVRQGVDAAIEKIRPGAPTWEPPVAGRDVLVKAGYPEIKFGMGHQLGRATHDGGPGLQFRKEGTPEWLMEPGNVFTAEGLETLVEGRGWVSLEEDVLVTDTGHQVLTHPQTELWLVH
jgi:Xaa-Pro aminopeptidase